MNLDHTTDSTHKELYAFLNGTELPAFVKDAELSERSELAELSKEAFADDISRSFPIHTPADTYLSNVYFLNKRAKLEKRYGVDYTAAVQSQIRKAGEIHGIKADLEAYDTSAMQKAAKDYSQDYIYETEFVDRAVSLFPVKTASDFQKAAEYFAVNTERYPFDWRRGIALGFINKAALYESDELPTIIAKYAGWYFPHPGTVKDELQRRSNKLVKEENRTKYAAVIEQADQAKTIDAWFKLAHEAHSIEFQDGRYQTKEAAFLGDIVDKIFSLDVEKVAEMLDVVEMAGETYPILALQKVSTDIYKEAFGIDINPSDRNQLRDILPTMPLSDVSLFKELSGISPL